MNGCIQKQKGKRKPRHAKQLKKQKSTRIKKLSMQEIRQKRHMMSLVDALINKTPILEEKPIPQKFTQPVATKPTPRSNKFLIGQHEINVDKFVEPLLSRTIVLGPDETTQCLVLHDMGSLENVTSILGDSKKNGWGNFYPTLPVMFGSGQFTQTQICKLSQTNGVYKLLADVDVFGLVNSGIINKLIQM
jgi:hypothetical protein